MAVMGTNLCLCRAQSVKSNRPVDAHKVELFGVQALKLVTLFARDQV